MKSLCVLLFLSASLCFAQETEFKPFSDDEALKEIIFEEEYLELDAYNYAAQAKEGSQRRIDIHNFQKAKFKMINGDLKTARFLLGRINDKTSPLTGVKQRYLAVIDFIEGRFRESLSKLSQPNLQTSTNYKQICLLKLVNMMALNDGDAVRREAPGCMSQTSDYSKNDQFWLDTMVKLKTRDQTGIKKNMIMDILTTLSDDEQIKLWMKTGLYLSREEEIIFMLGGLPESSYQSKKLREIVGFLFMRKGNFERAVKFVDDIDSANAENIKGTFNLYNREYELAFGHFKLALKKKQDSANALERAIPLAWLLKQWDDGLQMVSSSTNRSLDNRKKKALAIAFMIRQKKFIEAQKELALLRIDFKNVPPYEVLVMETYVNLILSANDIKYDRRKIEETSEAACKAFDIMGCWISLQFIQWDNLGKTITRDEPIYTDKTLTVESLKTKQIITPLKEVQSVDQSDIEELDSRTVNIPGV